MLGVIFQQTDTFRQLLQEAKLELRKSKRKDYYKILGVDKNANDDEVSAFLGSSFVKIKLLHGIGKTILTSFKISHVANK